MSQLDYLGKRAADSPWPDFDTPEQQDFRLRCGIYDLVTVERASQDAKWGARRVQSGPLWSAILTEEVGEAARAMLQQDREHLVEELVQVMAVASAWIEALALGNDGIGY